MASNYFSMTAPSWSHAMRVGLFVLALYVICLVWPSIFPYSADVLNYHLIALKLSFPGFQGFTLGSVVWGGVLSFVYGFVGSIIFHALHSDCCKGK